MPLYTRSGGLLTRSGSLADNSACCCDIRFCTCNVTAPSSVSLEITLGSLVSTFGTPGASCDRASVEARVNKTYILSQSSPSSLSWVYGDGETNIVFQLGCLSGSGFLQITWAISGFQPCWNRFDLLAPYDDTPDSLSVCDFGTTDWNQAGDVFIVLNPGTLMWSQRWTITAKATAL